MSMSDEREAFDRLEARYDRGGTHRTVGEVIGQLADAADAVKAVAMAVWTHKFYADDGPGAREDAGIFAAFGGAAAWRARYVEPTRDDILDALTQVAAYRASVDRNERELLLAARAAGVEWEEIGEALGYPTRSAKQAAAGRAARLAHVRPVTRLDPRRRRTEPAS